MNDSRPNYVFPYNTIEMMSDPMSQQSLMEKLIENLNPGDKSIFQGTGDMYMPYDSWHGVQCDENGDVLRIIWDRLFQFDGSLNFQYLPPKIREFNAHKCKLLGIGDLAFLPESLVKLHLPANKLSGTLDFSKLPHGIEEIDLSFNEFEGEVELRQFPRHLVYIGIAKNNLNGGLQFSDLPKSARIVDLHGNRFCGDLLFGSLPRRLLYLDLSCNAFDCHIDSLHDVPKGITELMLHSNKLTGHPVFCDLPPILIKLTLHGNFFRGYTIAGDIPTGLRQLTVDYPVGMTVHFGPLLVFQYVTKRINLIGKRKGHLRKRFSVRPGE